MRVPVLTPAFACFFKQYFARSTNMDNREKTVNLMKHILLAMIVGPIVGAIDAFFGRGLLLISSFRDAHVLFLVPFLPLAGLAITYMYYRYSKLSLKGMTLVFETGHAEREEIPKALVPLVMIGTWITHLFGGSAGREGVAVQIGATVSHTIGRKLNMPDNGRIMLVTGMAAGFAGLFQTPLTATFFAIEVITAGVLDYEALLPALIASYLASFTSSFLGLEKFSENITRTVAFQGSSIGKVILLGIAFGLTGWCFSFVLAKAKKFMGEKIENPYIRIGIVSIPLAILLLVFFAGRYCGLGTNLIKASFEGGSVYAYDWILKLLFTILTLSIGFQGGEVTPLFSIGASLGYVLGSLMGLPPEVTAALGYAAVFGSATNTLIAPILIGLEVFGSRNILVFVIVCTIAYILNGNGSIYGAQKVFHKKTIDRD